MISVVLCSPDPVRLERGAVHLRALFRGEEVEVITVDAASRAEGYNRGIERSRGEIVVLAEEDVEIVTDRLGPRLRAHLDRVDIVGVAGASLVAPGAWHDAGPPYVFGQLAEPSPNGGGIRLVNLVAGASLVPAMSVLSGLLLAFRRRVVEEHRFDAARFDGEHFHDVDFTFGAHLLGFTLGVCSDIAVVRSRRADRNDAWQRAKAQFVEKYADRFTAPAVRHELAAVTVGSREEALARLQYRSAAYGTAHRPAVFHVYAFCWNEARILPAFLRHYQDAARIVVYDNESSDGSAAIVRAAGRDVVTFATGGLLDDARQAALRNSVWKASRGEADFVIVQDMDELVHFPRHPNDIVAALTELRAEGVTAVRGVAYDIVADDAAFEAAVASPSGQSLVAQVHRGYRVGAFSAERAKTGRYDKFVVFNPHAVDGSDFGVGGHQSQSLVHCRAPADPGAMAIFHYRHTGLDHERARTVAIRERRSPRNREEGWAAEYAVSDAELEATLARLYADAEGVLVDLGRSPVLFPDLVATRAAEAAPPYLVAAPAADPVGAALRHGHGWEPDVARFVRRLCRVPDEVTFVDVGAGAGVHAFAARQAGARVVAIEGDPATFLRLARGARANGWTDALFRLVDGRVDAPALTLDGIVPDAGGIVVLRLSVDGKEAEVLEGMSRLLREGSPARVVLVELDPNAPRASDVLAGIIAPLERAGFSDRRIVVDHARAGRSAPVRAPTDDHTSFDSALRAAIEELDAPSGTALAQRVVDERAALAVAFVRPPTGRSGA